MSIKVWTVEFGWNYNSKQVEAETVEIAIDKAWKLLQKNYGKHFKKETNDYWVRKVECEVETDD